MAEETLKPLQELTAAEAVVELKMHKANGIKVPKFSKEDGVKKLRKIVGEVRKQIEEEAEDLDDGLGANDEDVAETEEETTEDEETNEDEADSDEETEEEDEAEEEVATKPTLTVTLPDGASRTYTRRTHGPKYAQLAKAFAKNKGGKMS